MKSYRFLLLRTFSVLLIAVFISLCGAAFAETKKSERVTFNFIDVELSTVTKFISEITKKNFIFDERVKGKITIIAPSKLSVDDAYSLFTSVLELKGFTVVSSGIDAYKIVPAAEAKQRGMSLSTKKQPVNESYIARLIPLTQISSDDALKFLQPVISRDGHISTFGPGNLLLVIDSGLNMEKIISIIEAIDQPSVREEPEIVILKFSSAEVIARILNEGLGRGRIRAVSGQPVQSEESKAVSDQRLNAVVIFGDKGARDSMRALIKLLDIPSPEAQGRINVYFLENADATEMAKVLEGIMKSAQSTRQATAAAPGTQPVSPFEAAGGISITPDKSSNALVVVASPADYQNLVQVIKQLDKRRKQVFVEAMIVEASMDKLRELGTKWRAIGRHNGEPVVIGGVGSIDSSSVQSIVRGLSGLTIGGMGNYLSVPITGADGTTADITVPGFAALFNLNEFKDIVNVLSTPQILTSDNKEAEIVVGENVPFITKRESDPTRTLSMFTSIERKDVGITLKITPQITEGDYVKLDIYQEISSVKQESENITISVGPTTTKRSTKTSVAAKDRQTVVIGGLMQEKEEETITKVPLLGDIPLLGWLFKSKSKSKTKTNLLVFLTPHIVKEDATLANIAGAKEMEFAKAERQYVEGELFIKFKEGVTDERIAAIFDGEGASVIKFIENIKVYHIKLKKEQSVEEAVEELLKKPEIEYAEPNYRMKKAR
jgi:general secretion pathway protein D